MEFRDCKGCDKFDGESHCSDFMLWNHINDIPFCDRHSRMIHIHEWEHRDSLTFCNVGFQVLNKKCKECGDVAILDPDFKIT